MTAGPAAGPAAGKAAGKAAGPAGGKAGGKAGGPAAGKPAWRALIRPACWLPMIAVYLRSLWVGPAAPALTGRGLAAAALSVVLIGVSAYWTLPPERRRAIPFAVAMLVTALSGSALALLARSSPALTMAYFAVGAAGHRSPRRLGWATLAGSGAVLALPAVGGRYQVAASLVASVVVAYLVGLNTRQHRIGQERAELLLAEAQVALEEKARAAALAERARIAREIHDVLAHSLSALAVHLEGARLALRRAGDEPALAVSQVERARRLAREGLEETRRAVEALRGDPLPLPDLLTALAELYRADHGAPAVVTVHGTPRPLAPDVALAGYRVAQEAVTNVGRHAPGAPVTIRLAYGEGELCLEVRNGPGREEPLAGGTGYGLTGMRERAALLGGRLDAGPEEGGWRVLLALPG
ncbi:MAG: sensor histidine kinase [Mycobacteriales bacterium]